QPDLRRPPCAPPTPRLRQLPAPPQSRHHRPHRRCHLHLPGDRAPDRHPEGPLDREPDPDGHYHDLRLPPEAQRRPALRGAWRPGRLRPAVVGAPRLTVLRGRLVKPPGVRPAVRAGATTALATVTRGFLGLRERALGGRLPPGQW